MSKVSVTATYRLRSDYMRMKKDPVPYVTAEPLPSNILEWHYVVQGPEDSPYYGGFYHGKLMFPMEYPFRPPSIYMTTPSGRFKTNTRLCLSISDFHPDTWNPAWSVATILTGLLSFMLEKSPTFGSIESSDAEKQAMAIKSWQFNLDNKIFCELFPEIVQIIKEKQQKRLEEMAARVRLMEKNNNVSSACGSPSSASVDANTSTSMAVLTNMAVVTGFALIAWLVRYIVLGLYDEDL
ncbi:Ubiquitin-conjugating enzyme E2 J2 [Hyalella azteca]|uniref:Ubiquitin-conjugating enzyme E2 J2 n=1 Tax=Hyalella azteca TaxID=294128 RepID=A0A6A0GQY5_HYAAZ|nr:ubiquitin-conjugating enzyme E2 J2-like [Hyalella azteca]KAA0183270.1 Ubiquitin-conjugating enzyme E2 J2 [Hyalella azteca]